MYYIMLDIFAKYISLFEMFMIVSPCLLIRLRPTESGLLDCSGSLIASIQKQQQERQQQQQQQYQHWGWRPERAIITLDHHQD